MNKRIYLSSPTTHGEEQKFIKEAFDTNWVAPLGANVDNFEKEMAEYINIPHAAALSSGTGAIHLALRLLELKQNDIVFVSSLTFSASCNPIMYEKAIPVFIDSEPDTWNMSPKALKRAFKKYPRAKAVIAVHLYGTPAKLDELMAICDEYNVPLIEDAAESLGATYKGQDTGTFGRMGILSFNGNKIITTSGGGMLVSREKELIDNARFLATQARDPARHYQHSQVGFNYRMSNIVAGIGRGQLLHLDEHMARKQKIYQQYKEAFADIPALKMNPLNKDGQANNWLSCVIIEDGLVNPDQIMDALEAENIECRPIWKPMHQQPVFAGYDYFPHKKELDISADIFARGLCLPSDIKNTDEDMDKIIKIVRGFFE
ncbi:MAG: aminotransferase class I/II-fold pyridoxal phosphate-dependent enzyme [Lachnospiraceae bacterium]|nr:aminotransferase class I/II-fold pyridoxal phosphate-dependent enzyme [Lachnospiraceae bacterium]